MKKINLPAIWLIVLIVGLPLLSETVYTPSLPDIAHALSVTDAWVEYTLTIYLFGFAVGTLFWGNLSDKWGRKPCILLGLGIFIIGCIGCYASDSISLLMTSRFVQAFGGSTGSVLGQAVCRDAYHGSTLGKLYATVGGALAIFPAIGPVIGGSIDQAYGWPAIFLFLIICGTIVLGLTTKMLPETHPHEDRNHIPLMTTLIDMICDVRVIGFAFLVAACNGIAFSFYAEGPFYMIELLGLSPSQYGLLFVGIASATLVGGIMGRRLHNHHSSMAIMDYGLGIILFGSVLWILLICVTQNRAFLIWGSLTFMMIITSGIALVTSNALSLSLVNYKNRIGTASSLFGFFYYTLISLFTLGMGYSHTETVFPMPIYFGTIAVLMIVVRRTMLVEKTKKRDL
ncbi:MAG: multidrug effflux MFS transporter [Alphaproteobacteria bacterium]|nr:multidrug effflux MFS transporter [Alphaproteobacteria bacterium]